MTFIIRSGLTSKLALSVCPFNFFYVGFWGRSFPNSFQNVVFIYRADQLARLEDFQDQIKKIFPEAEILSHSEPVPEDIKEKFFKKIQIFPVKPVAVEKDHFCRHFEHRRSFSDNGKSGIENTWVEKRTFTATDAFPGIAAFARVINVKINKLRPVELAILSLREKNLELRTVIDSGSRDLGHLAMLLQGVIDPGVNGGYKVYETTFLKSDSDASSSEKTNLGCEISRQIPLLEKALDIYSRFAPNEMRPFEEALKKSFEKMKSDVESKYGKSSFSTPTKVRQRCLRRINDPESESIESNSSSDIKSKYDSTGRLRPGRPVSSIILKLNYET